MNTDDADLFNLLAGAFTGPQVVSTASFSADRLYRYELWRRWGDGPYALFIGLNPSTADELNDDPTIRRCIAFAKSWGYSALCMSNLFAYRATQPKDMMKITDPVGEENDRYLRTLSVDAGVVVAAWGKDGCHLKRDMKVKELIPNLHCLKLNKDGSPAHPLYLKGNLRPIPFS